MKREGRLVRWENSKGFGFIRSPEVSADVFVHLRDFVDRSTAPRVGMSLQFEEIHVGGKGPRAMAVQALGPTLLRPASPATPQRPTHTHTQPRGHAPAAREYARCREATPASSSALPFIVLSVGHAALVTYGVHAVRIPPIALGGLLLVSLLTFFVYGFDKNAAETGRRRVPEKNLHLLSLVGGWPGAWCAQRLFRHKVRKPSFMKVYWATVLLHIAAVMAWVGRILPPGLTAL